MTLPTLVNAVRLETPQRRAALLFENDEFLETEKNGWTVRFRHSGRSFFFPSLCSSLEREGERKAFTIICPLWFALNYELEPHIQRAFVTCPVRRTKEI